MGRPRSALDTAVIESWHSTVEFELRRIERQPPAITSADTASASTGSPFSFQVTAAG